jgi:hypothetical protein
MLPTPAPPRHDADAEQNTQQVTTATSGPEWQFNAVQGRTSRHGTRLTHVLSGAELHVRNGRLIPGVGYGEAGRGPRRELARAGAILRLRLRQRYHIHAAGVVDPAGRAWLLAGPTGSGKSTLAYALTRAGWAVLGDDGVIVEVQPDGVMVMGWREPLRVSSALAGVFPELARADAATLAIPGDARQRMAMVMPTARCARLTALVWVQQGPVDELVRCSPTQALVDLVRESAWVLIADGATPAHLAALRHIVTEVPSYRLTHSAVQLRAIERTLLSAQPM